MKKIIKTTLRLTVLFSVLLAAGCADTVTFSQASNIEPVGGWYGFWHGITFPFAFIGSLFDSSISVYAIYNNGGWYDFGFFIGVGGFSATAAAS